MLVVPSHLGYRSSLASTNADHYSLSNASDLRFDEQSIRRRKRRRALRDAGREARVLARRNSFAFLGVFAADRGDGKLGTPSACDVRLARMSPEREALRLTLERKPRDRKCVDGS
jgi:hypothetical protein